MTPEQTFTPAELATWNLKVKRAQEHLDRLNTEFQWFKEGRPHDFRVEQDPKTEENVMILSRADPIPIKWSLIIGDCVQNLRSALDHITCRLELDHSGKVGTRTEFPIYDRCKPYKDARAGKIGGLSPDAQTVIDGLQPISEAMARGPTPCSCCTT